MIRVKRGLFFNTILQGSTKACCTLSLVLSCGILSMLLAVPTVARGQASGLLGTEFWTGFLLHSTANMNPPKRDVFQLCILPLHDCDVVISHAPEAFVATSRGNVPVYPDTILLHLRADSAAFVTLPHDDDLMSPALVPVRQGIHVSSTDTIALYTLTNTIDSDTVTDFESGEFEMTSVWPVEKVGCDYWVNVYEGMAGNSPEILAVATEDSVRLMVEASPDGQSPQQEHLLRIGEVLRVRYPNAAGRHIFSPTGGHFSLQAGVGNTYIPIGVMSSDQIYASMPPSDYWGRTFVLSVSPYRLNDRVLLVSQSDNCRVTLDGDSLTTLSQGQTYEFSIDTSRVASLLESSSPISVCVFLTGAQIGCADSNQSTPGSYSGDPSMYPLCPVEQWYDKSMFYSYDAPYHAQIVLGVPVMTFYPHYFLGIATRTDCVAGMRIDGNPIDTAFSVLPYDTAYSFARFRISGGAHRLENALGPFEAHAVTLKNHSAIAVATGWAAVETPLSTYDTTETCQGEDVAFSLNSATDPVWDFGDGTTGQGSPILHVYEDSGTYTLTARYQRSLCQRIPDTLRMLVTVHPTAETQMFDTVDSNLPYSWHGQALAASGDYPVHLSTRYGCDSLVTLHLTVTHSSFDTTGFSDTSALFIPNVFTPDRETNNRFFVCGRGIQDFSLTIFSRWGDVIYHTDSLSAQWDGSYRGRPCLPGAYTYLICYTTKAAPKSTFTRIGQVVILR